MFVLHCFSLHDECVPFVALLFLDIEHYLVMFPEIKFSTLMRRV